MNEYAEIRNFLQDSAKIELDRPVSKVTVRVGRKMYFWACRIFKDTVTNEGEVRPALLSGAPVELELDHELDGEEFYLRIVE